MISDPYEQGVELDPLCVCGHRRSQHHIGRGPCMKPPFGQCGCWEYQRGTWWRKVLRKLQLG